MSVNRRPYCTHARLDSDPDDGRGCPSCAIEAQYPNARAYSRAGRIERRIRAHARVFGPYLVIIMALVFLGLVTGAIERL